jgi:hypothetical protein
MPVKFNPQKCKFRLLILSPLPAFSPFLLIGLELFNYKGMWNFSPFYLKLYFSSTEILIGFTSKAWFYIKIYDFLFYFRAWNKELSYFQKNNSTNNYTRVFLQIHFDLLLIIQHTKEKTRTIPQLLPTPHRTVYPSPATHKCTIPYKE